MVCSEQKGKGKFMFKKVFLTIAFIASAVVMTGCGKNEATQPAENGKPVAEAPAAEQKATVDADFQKGLDEYSDVVSYLKNESAKKGEYPKNLDALKLDNKAYPIYTYMFFGPKEMVFIVENGKTSAYFCSNKDMDNCNAAAKKDGVTYTAYKDWVIVTKK